MRRSFAAVLSVLAVSFTSTLLAQESRESVPLNDWRVPFEQIRAKVLETEPLRIAERSLHPSVNAVPSAASHFITIVPCRVVDTRNPSGAYGGPKLVGGASRTFSVSAGPCTGIPASAAAYSLNFTVLNGEGASGFLTAYPTGSTRPTVSTLNYGVGNLVANAAIVPGGTSGSIDVYVNYNVDIIIDINGYFAAGVVTGLTASGGLSATATTGNVDVSIADGGITNVKVNSAAGISESKLALNFSTHSNANDPTAGEKAALAGTGGTVGAANRYLTQATATKIVFPLGLGDFDQVLGSPVRSKVSYGVFPALTGWTLPSASSACIMASSVIPPIFTGPPTLIVGVHAAGTGTAQVNIAGKAVPPNLTCTSCFSSFTTQNLVFTTANTMQRAQWLANITVCETGISAGPGDLLLIRLCNVGLGIDFTVTSVEVIWN